MANVLKMALSEAILSLRRRGWSRRRIARELGIDRETVARHLRTGTPSSESKPANAPLGSSALAAEPKPANAPIGSDHLADDSKPAIAPLGSAAFGAGLAQDPP